MVNRIRLTPEQIDLLLEAVESRIEGSEFDPQLAKWDYVHAEIEQGRLQSLINRYKKGTLNIPLGSLKRYIKELIDLYEEYGKMDEHKNFAESRKNFEKAEKFRELLAIYSKMIQK